MSWFLYMALDKGQTLFFRIWRSNFPTTIYWEGILSWLCILGTCVKNYMYTLQITYKVYYVCIGLFLCSLLCSIGIFQRMFKSLLFTCAPYVYKTYTYVCVCVYIYIYKHYIYKKQGHIVNICILNVWWALWTSALLSFIYFRKKKWAIISSNISSAHFLSSLFLVLPYIFYHLIYYMTQTPPLIFFIIFSMLQIT